eukprot:10498045-Alexandrium_andersonii.AAC.1
MPDQRLLQERRVPRRHFRHPRYRNGYSRAPQAWEPRSAAPSSHLRNPPRFRRHVPPPRH